MNTPDIDLAAVAVRVKAARAVRGWNQTMLAEAADVSQPTVSRMESGNRPVTLVEADKLATALGVALDTLLYGSRVQERVLVALRIGEDAERGAATSAGIELLELDDRLDAVVDELRQTPLELPPVPTEGTPVELGRQLAARLRDQLGLASAPVSDPLQLIEELTGVDAGTRPLPEGVSGMCLCDPERSTSVVLTNSEHPAERQRFTLAHELAHLLFQDGAHVDADADAARGPKETRAHEFARCFLAPQHGIVEWLQRARSGDTTSTVTEEHLGLLARYFGVSAKVIAIQLKGLQLYGSAEPLATPALASRYGWRREYDTSQQAARMPRPPLRLVRRAQAGYQAGRVGLPVLAMLTGRSESDVLAELNESGISPRRYERKRLNLDALIARSIA